MMMITQLLGESEESINKRKAKDKGTTKSKKLKQSNIKSNEDYPSDDEKREVNIISLNFHTEFDLFKSLTDNNEDNLELLESLNSDSDTIRKQVESKKNHSKSYQKKISNKKKHSKKISQERKESNSDEISGKSTSSQKRDNNESSISSEDPQSAKNLNFLNMNSKHESINIITDRIIHEVYLDLSLNTNPFVDYILYERQINKMMNKEKELVPTLVRSLINSFSLLIKDRASKLPNFEKFKTQKKDQDGNYLFNLNDYKIIIDIHWFYEIILRLIRQIKDIFDAPLNMFNKICKIDFDFESVFKEIFFNRVFYKEIACLLFYAEYKLSTPSFVSQIVKKISDDTKKLIPQDQFVKINELLGIKSLSAYSFVEFMTNLRSSISDTGKEKISEVKICVDEQSNKKDTQSINVIIEKKEKELEPILNKSHQYKSIDELYNFIVSNGKTSQYEEGNFTEIKTESLSSSRNVSNQLKKKVIKKKMIKKKIALSKKTDFKEFDKFESTPCSLSLQNEENLLQVIDDPEVDNFKKILAFQSINANTVNKIKPILKKEWLIGISN